MGSGRTGWTAWDAMGRSAPARQDAAEHGEMHGTGAIRLITQRSTIHGHKDARAMAVPPEAAFKDPRLT